mgnify:CR=1 FL=1
MSSPIVIWDESLRQRVIELISSLNIEKPWAVTIEKYVEKRSLNQNALYWKWVGRIAQETGNDPDAIHDTLKNKFLPPKEFSFMGEKVLYRSSAKLDTREMSTYMDRVHALATQELGIMLPLPEDGDAAEKTQT